MAVRDAFTWRADYEGVRSVSPRREHALGTSQLTELASSGPHAARAATSGAGIGGAARECVPHRRDAIVKDVRLSR
jgi:hypothetical protein